LFLKRKQQVQKLTFTRYYIEIGEQPYEIGAIFIEGSYNYGVGTSEDEFK
jgi:hypothetical protein|tara:strand:- start:1056 stop:1205 length:150 start_codon:yes stop_codon:yes gene_type:complete